MIVKGVEGGMKNVGGVITSSGIDKTDFAVQHLIHPVFQELKKKCVG